MAGRLKYPTLAAILLVVSCILPMALAPSRAEAAVADYVIEISVDGLGSSYLEGLIYGNQLPSFRRLQTEGAWTLNARNDFDNTVTVPNHTTMVTGRAMAGAAGHNWTGDGTPPTNVTLHTNKGSYVASVFDVAHDNGLSTAMFANKSKFILFQQSYSAAAGAPDLLPPDNGTNKIDTYYYTHYSADLVPAYIAAMNAAPLQLSFLHLRDPDDVGHASGWGTAAYNDALKTIDGYLGSILNMVDSSPVLQGRTTIILTGDHGGRGIGHSTITEPLNYTIPFFIWGSGVTGNADLYGLNAATRLDPGAGRPAYSAPGQPIRNGDIANLGLQLLGLGPVPGSTINADQSLNWHGDAPPPTVVAFSAFNEAAAGATKWAPPPGYSEVGFTVTSTPLGAAPVAGTYSSQTSPLRFRIQNAEAEATFDPVDLLGSPQASASIEIMLKDITYAAGNSFRVTLTNGTDTITVAEADAGAPVDTLNSLPKGPFLHYAVNIPDGWTTATLKISGRSVTEALDFDNVYFAALPAPPATLFWAGAVDNRWDANRTPNWSAGGWAWRCRDGDNVVFGDTAAAQPISITETVSPGAVLVDNTAGDVGFGGAGSFAGPGGLTKNGAGSLTLATTNTYAGGTQINAGRLIVAADGALGAGPVRLGDTAGSSDASLLAAGPFVVDRNIAVQDDGSPSSARILGGINTTGTAVFSGDITIGKDLLLTAALGGEVRLTGALDDSAGRTITMIGDGTVIFDGFATYGPGSLLDVDAGTVLLNTDAGSSDAANLSITVTDAVVNFGADQHLDTLTIGDGGEVILAGAHAVVLNHLVMSGMDFGPTTLTPEPATLALVALGGLTVLLRRKRR